MFYNSLKISQGEIFFVGYQCLHHNRIIKNIKQIMQSLWWLWLDSWLDIIPKLLIEQVDFFPSWFRLTSHPAVNSLHIVLFSSRPGCQRYDSSTVSVVCTWVFSQYPSISHPEQLRKSSGSHLMMSQSSSPRLQVSDISLVFPSGTLIWRIKKKRFYTE